MYDLRNIFSNLLSGKTERGQLHAMLLSSVSHDLKTPLASVIGSLSVCRNLGGRLSDENRQTLIDNALTEALRLDSFITNILDMTRLESGQIVFKAQWSAPHHLIQDIQKRLHARLRQHALAIQPPRIQNLEIRMDAMMTGQILQNILDNACKYTPPGTRIEISWAVDEKSRAVLRVQDFGPGIAPDKLQEIFNKYTRIKQDMPVAGTGLGLAIAKAVMKAQGGDILASNHPDGGALFTLTFPHWRINAKQGESHAV